MRIPFGVPTVSDATKLGLAKCEGRAAVAGGQLYQLLLQLSVSDDFANLSNWTEADSDGDNVYVSGGVLYMNGNGSYAANGVYLTAGIAKGTMEVSWKYKNSNSTSALATMGLHSSGALPTTATNQAYAAWRKSNNATAFLLYQATVLQKTLTLTAGTVYNIKLRLDPDEAGAYTRSQWWISGGTEYSDWTLVCETWTGADLAATIYPYLQRLTDNAGVLSEFSEFRVYKGYATDGPTLTYVADAGAGNIFASIDWTNIAAVGGFATTNLRFKRSIDSGVASYDAGWLTLAQLQALGVQTGDRYVRLQVQVNSDGSTQAYAGELNSDDACELIDEAARNTITPAYVEAGHNYTALGAPAVGTLPASACSCLAPICLGVIDAEPYAQGLLRVRFYEMICLEGVPYRYDFHIKPLLDGALTKAEIDNGTYYSCSFYQDQINPIMYSGTPFGDPGIGIVALAIESPGDSGDNVHPFTNQQYQVAVRAVAINQTNNVVAEDDNEEVAVSYSSGYQGLVHMEITDWPCLELCTPLDLKDLQITALPQLSLPDVNVVLPDVPVLNVNLLRNKGGI